MVKYLTYIWILVVITSCDSKLSLAIMDNQSSALQLDGIYLYKDSLDIVDMYFLYEDGTILSRGSVYKDKLEDKLASLETSTDDKYKSMKFLWGRYIINGDVIMFEKWAPTDKPYEAFVKEGKILNDSTFIINKTYNASRKYYREIEQTYKFRKTKTKPDNNNKWVGK